MILLIWRIWKNQKPAILNFINLSLIIFHRQTFAFSKNLCHRNWFEWLSQTHFYSFQIAISKARPKFIKYRNYKNFDKNYFLNDLNNINVRFDKENPSQYYDSLITSFLEVVNRHAPLKKKSIRGNHASFVNKELRKAIYTRSRLRNKMCILSLKT